MNSTTTKETLGGTSPAKKPSGTDKSLWNDVPERLDQEGRQTNSSLV